VIIQGRKREIKEKVRIRVNNKMKERTDLCRRERKTNPQGGKNKRKKRIYRGQGKNHRIKER